jgi:hypothetical protein
MHAHRATWRRRAAALLLAPLAAMLVLLPQAAAADSGPQCTWDGASGCASFQSDGDRFYVCDSREDDHSVVVVYSYMASDGQVKTGYAWNYWGPYRHGGCRTDTEDHSGPMVRTTCLADYAKPGGRPGKVLWNTCGGNVKDDFGK